MTGLRDLAHLVRAPAALSVPGDVICGAVACGGALGRRTAGLSAASICLYWAGMAANDWADRELDAKERPERPIPSGRVTANAALRTAVGLSAAGLISAGLAGGRRALAVAAPLTAAVWLYDVKLKQTPAGPAAMAACRGLDVLLGASLSASSGGWRRALPSALTIAGHTYTVTVLSRREVTGSGRLLPAATLAGTAGIAARAGSASATTAVPQALAAWYSAGYSAAQLRALSAPDAGRIRAAVGAGITRLPALQGALIARAGGNRCGLAVAACAPIGQALARRLSPT